MHHCEFCRELSGAKAVRFSDIYGRNFGSRVIARYAGFVAIPTIGQLFKGSILVLPIDHVETSAHLSLDRRRDLANFLKILTRFMRSFGHPIYFEHGSTAAAASSCGIYHAHVHIVPLPAPLALETIFPEHTDRSVSLGECWTELSGASQYLVIGDDEQTLSTVVVGSDKRFPSQFFRRRLAALFLVSAPWNWRDYTKPEDSLLATIDAWRAKEVHVIKQLSRI